MVYDGTGAAPFRADLGIRGDTVAFIGTGSGADRVLDVEGLSVAPGFIDTHGHSEFAVFREGAEEGKLLQGVTTEINGNCGLSAAPLLGEALRQREGDLEEAGIDVRWAALAEYLALLEGRGLGMNFATLAGHGSIRASVMGYEAGRPAEAELSHMKRLLGESLHAGALGLSTGLIYPPGLYAENAELIELARSGKALSGNAFGGFIYTSHMRSEGRGLLASIQETLALGREAGVPVHISHLKTAGPENWHLAEDAVSLMEEARARGVPVTCDRYPYTAASTDLDALLPTWVFEGGSEEELKRITTPEVRARITDELRAEHPDAEYWRRVAVATVSSDKNRWMEGRSLEEVAGRLGGHPADALLQVLAEERLRVDAVLHSMSEDNLRRFLSLPYAMVGSDSTARPLGGKGKPHPRAFGTFPRFLARYAPDLAEGVRKLTSLPAGTFGLRRRGQLREGFFADIVVFRPEDLRDRATYEEPYRRPEGISHVLVNGVPVVFNGETTGERPGRVLRNGG